MNKTLLLFFLFTLVGSAGFAQTKSVKIKGNKSVRFFYDSDSTCLKRKETKKIVRAFYHFYRMVQVDDFQAYLSCLGPVTIQEIPEEKLKRKFKKFKGYGVNLFGDITIRSIKKSKLKCKETEPFYTCIVKLPEGQSIKHRVGFDPLKKSHFNGIETYTALFLTATEAGYKIVIPW